MKDIIIVGAGGFGRETVMEIEEINQNKPTWNLLGFIDDNLNALDEITCDYKVLGTIKDWTVKGNEEYALAVANTRTKKLIVEALKAKGAKFATLIHPTARVGKTTELGEGVIITPRVDITTNCTIGNFVFCNVAAQIGHDSIIGDYCTLFPNSSISGGGVLGEGVTIGTSAATHPGIKIGDYATVGMNSAVVRNVKANTTVMGVPATKIL